MVSKKTVGLNAGSPWTIAMPTNLLKENQAATAALKTINPVIFALACCGDSAGLDYLLNDGRAAPTTAQTQEILGNLVGYSDVEEGGGAGLLSASSLLLEGVTDQGDTALHAVASCGDGESFLESADIIYGKARHLLFVQNKHGDTPVHCAARAGKSKMVSRLIDLAKGRAAGTAVAAGVKPLLEMENGLKETALHDAVRAGDEEMVERLMQEDPELAGFPRNNGGASPLYLAIMLENEAVVDKLYEKSSSGGRGLCSYSGPNGQNALHAAALRGPAFTEKVLKWEKTLSARKDETGSTPLHFAAALGQDGRRHGASSSFWQLLGRWRKGYYSALQLQASSRTDGDGRKAPGLAAKLGIAAANLRRLQDDDPRSVCSQLLAANSAALYEPDRRGSFPIHVAASLGATRTVALFLGRYPSSAGLRDADGRTFLHVAVEKKAIGVVDHANRDPSLRWLLELRDKNGDTAMHLAVRGGSLRMLCLLLGNTKIRLDLTNGDGETCLDLARRNIPPGVHYNQNSEAHIRRALTMVGARSGTWRQDHAKENRDRIHQLQTDQRQSTEMEHMADTTRNLSIGSVLIATVTFGATFALPGGYRADDHRNGGSPTLAGRYAFDAFIMANTLAFLCSSTATVGFMFSGTSMVSTRSRKFHLISAVYFMAASVNSLTAAFALGVYAVLAPVAYRTAVAICVLSPSVLLWKNVDFYKRWLLLAGSLRARKGLLWTSQVFAPLIPRSILFEFWPLIIIFCWAAFANSTTH